MANTVPPNSAFGSLLGYVAQIPHMLFELANHFDEPDTVIAVEGLDDITVDSGGQIELTQLKNVTSHNNPASNSSVVFWKAIYNWCKLYEDKYISLNEKCVFKFVIRSIYDLNKGSLIQKLSNNNSSDNLSTLLDEIKEEYEKEEYTLLSNSYFIYCFDKSNIDYVSKVISQFELVIYNSNYDDELKKAFFSQPIKPMPNNLVFDSMLGWIIKTITTSNKSEIRVKDYKKVLIYYNRKQIRAKYLNALSSNPIDKEVNDEYSNYDTYIKQMDIIELEFSVCIRGVSDYLRTKSEIVALEDEGYSLPYDELENEIKDCWDNTKLVRDGICASTDEISKGKTLYGMVMNNVRAITIGNYKTPFFFNKGYAQILSNKKEIGWHDRYLEILK